MRIIKTISTALLLSLCPIAAAQTGSENDAIAELETQWSALYGDRDLEGIMALMGTEVCSDNAWRSA